MYEEKDNYLTETATNLVKVSLSPDVLGKIAARTSVKRPEVDDRTFTTPTLDATRSALLS